MLDELVQQVAFRWRGDDGSETAATWVAAENVDITINTAAPVKFRLRLVAAETNGDTNVRNQMYWIQANLNGGTWVTLTESNQGVGFVLIPSDFVAHGISTTEQLLSNPAPYTAGHFISQTPSGLEISLTGGNRTEWEYSIGLDPGLFNTGDFFEFRIVGDGDIPLDAYQVIALFNLTKPTTVSFSGTAVAAAQSQGLSKRGRGYTGETEAVANVSANLRWIGILTGTINAVASVFGILGGNRVLSSVINAVATVSASIGKAVFYSASVTGTAIVTADFVTAFFMGTASASAVAQASSAFNVRYGLSGSALGQSLASGGFVAIRGYTGNAAGQAFIGARLRRGLPSSGHTQTGVFGN